MNRQFRIVYIVLALVMSSPAFFTPLSGQTLSKAEYYFDTDPGFGNGTAIALSGTDMIANFDADMSSLSAGVHLFYIRTQDSDGRWSETAYKILNKSLLQDPLPDLVKAEYFFDTDPGFGNGTTVPLSGNNSTPTFNADMSALSPGLHTFYIRTQDSGGRWSETAYKILNKPLLQGTLPDLVNAEYFFDTDPGFGNGTAVPLSGNNSTPTFNADMSALSPGLHTFYIRTQDSDGRWSETAYKILYKPLLQDPLPDLVKAEYFFDTDPGFGNGTAVPLSGNNATPTFNADMSALSPGVHTFYIRTQDSGGRWSETAYKILYKPLLQGLLPDLVKAEYFFDTDPGFGNGTAVPLSGTNITTNFDADISTLSIGVHVFYIRTQDGDGRWSETAYQILNKPLLQGPLPDLVKAEYYFDTDPGFGNGIPLPLSGNNIVANFNADMSTLFPGVHQLYIRTLDSDGRWSETAYQSFTKEMTIVRMEYYFDTDPGYGNAPGTNYSGTDVRIETTLSIDMSGLTPGFHYLYLRSKDYAGAWSETAFRSIYIPEPVTSTAPEIIYTEYYLNTDPGYGNGTSVPLTGLPALSFTVCLDNATIGSNRLFVRSRDAGGRWSETAVSAAFNFSGPNCPAPTLPVTVSTTTNSALISWKKTKCTENYQIQYKMQGSSVWQTASTVDTFYTLTGLALCTDYDWQVSANCSPLTSTWTGTVTFTTSGSLYYQDADGDGYGNPAISALLCPPITGYVTNNTDCDDVNNDIHPGAQEVCNTLDDDCDGSTDIGSLLIYYADTDADGYGNKDETVTDTTCTAPMGYVTDSTDCDDGNLAIYPGATETCNLLDDDCDESTDEGVQNTYYADADTDGYGDDAVTILACSTPMGYVTDSTDCEDGNPYINPGVQEACNDYDDDCDGSVDEGVQNTYYVDADSDGYGNNAVTTMACTAPGGYVADSTDCDDADQYINGPHSWYFDGDFDGWYGQEVFACSPPSQDYWSEYTNGFDCDDNDAFVNGYAVEIQLNGIDDNCNGLVDEACVPEENSCDFYITRVIAGSIDQASTCGNGYENFESLSTLMPPGSLQTIAIAVSNAGQFVSVFIDFNGDHILDDPGSQVVSNFYVAANSTSTISFVMPSDAAMGDRLMRVISSPVESDFVNDPCYPYPGEVEDYTVQIACSVTPVTWYQDLDGDTFGNDEISQNSYCQPPGYVSIPGDCDDSEASINPVATDIGDSGVDENCNGIADDPCTPVIYAPCFTGYITEVSLGTIQNTTGCNGAYSDFSYLSTPLEMGDTANILLTTNSYIPILSIFIDFNDNEILDDPGERVAELEWLNSIGSTTSFVIPYDIIPGPHRMRILGSDNPWGDPPNPCGPHLWGEAEDYTLNILCPSQAVVYYADADGDGYGDPDSLISAADCTPAGYAINSMDCDDTNFSINPGEVEVVDNLIDDDCNGVIDELTYCDPVITGACSPEGSISIQRVVMGSIDHVTSCEVSGYGNYIFLSDTIAAGEDQEYSLTLSPQNASFATVALLLDINRDGDFDDFGEFLNYSFWYSYLNGPVSSGDFSIPVSLTPGNYTLRIMISTNYYAGACSGSGGEAEDYTLTVTCPVTPITYYADNDGDGYGDPNVFVEIMGCMPDGYVLNSYDCNDLYSEYQFTQLWYQDLDGDLFHGMDSAQCTPPAGLGWSLQSEGLDCDDTNGDYHTESFYYLDVDSDGYSVSDVYICIPPAGDGWSGEYGNGGGDCDDANADIHPGTEIFYNGLDDNCDGLVDTLIYCDPFIVDDCAYTHISQVILGTANQSSMCNNGYSDYSNLSIVAEAGDVVPFSVQTSGTSSLYVYIDYNHNGSWYENEELIYVNQDYQIGLPFTGSITLPDSLTEGYYRIRFVAVSSAFADPCFIYDGEMEDYSILIDNLCTLDADNDGYFASSCGGDDCDDNENTVHPGANEVCNTIDDDCDGNMDEGVQNTYFSDADGDGYGDDALDSDGYPDPAVTTSACAPPVGYVSDNTDCNDAVAAVNPGVMEICNGGADDDCNGSADNADPGITGQNTYYVDNDGDGFGNTVVLSCVQGAFVTNGTDCNDASLAINPGVAEVCNSLDDDCDLSIDEGLTLHTYYQDADGDLKGNPAVFIVSCFQPAGYVTNNTDCDDNSATACPKPSGMTTTNITDNSATVSWGNLACATKYRLEYRRKTPPISAWTVVYPTSPTFDITGLTGPNIQYQWRVATICSPNGTAAESGYASLQSFYTKYKVYTDADWDGFGEFGAAPSYVSSMPQSGYSYNTNDCDDAASTTYPGAPELCNGIDDDCDFIADEGANWFEDADGDGLGNSAVSLNACLQPEGYVSNSVDCNDNSSAALCGQATGVVAGNISFSSATITWTGLPCASGYTLMYRTYYPLGAFSTQFNTSGNTVTFTGLLPNTTYQYRIRSKCLSPNPVSVSTWTYYLFTTLPLPMGLSENDVQTGALTETTGMNFDIYPNPGDGFFNLRLASETAGDVQITVSDGLGKLVYSSVWSVYEGQNIDQFDLSFLTGGVYQVMIQQGDLVRTRKVVVVK